MKDKVTIHTLSLVPVFDVGTEAPIGFTLTAQWQTLNPEATPVPKPNGPNFFRVPIVPASETDNIPAKHNYSKIFERPTLNRTVK